MADLSEADWKRSTYCAHSNCVEIAFLGGLVALRDSKQSPGPVLLFGQTEWEDFLAGARNGEFDSIQFDIKCVEPIARP